MTDKRVSEMTDTEIQELAGARPLTYHEADAQYHGSLPDARRRYDELGERDLSARTAAQLRERGEFNPDDRGHRLVAESEPLSVAEHLEMLALGEVLARYYRHPAVLADAVKAGASWDQIGEARGTSAGQARQDYRQWAEGQHRLWQREGRWGLDDAEYAEAIRRTSEPEPTAAAYAAEHPVLCAHADDAGQGAHWLAPGEKCARQAGAGR